MKTCTGCGRRKPDARFHKKGSGRRHAKCSICRKKEKAEYVVKNRDKVDASNARYREENREVLAERQRRWREDHPEAYFEIHRRWKQKNKELVNAATHRRRTKLNNSAENYTAAEWTALKEAQNYTCLCCGRREPEIKLTVDHVIPVSCGGGNGIDNIQGLCKDCNNWKNARGGDFRKK